MRSEPTIAYVAGKDETNEAVYCKPVSDFSGDLRAGYWLYKAFTWLERLPIPPVP